MLRELMPEPEVLGLLSLLLLHDSRRVARVDHEGRFVPLDKQDRARWDHEQIAEGTALLEAAVQKQQPGPYQIQAAVAALHAQAPTPDSTDWEQIAALYGQLVRIMPTPVVALNHAVAVAKARGAAEGLALVDRLGSAGELDGYQPYHAARADLLRRLGRASEAAAAYQQTLALTTNGVEQDHLRRQLETLGSPPPVDFSNQPRRSG
jgi:RNA polymerase sigma-70 factor (ECF subfamily)